ncbi:MAG: hypothetical protein US69_C0025G0009 [candidate division TM6 bacterium GW2011_GWF2_38_10]|nr:MAG: hypothetical protein US69_C0025G0009 [candidate division TM6 bacterium GW2011_GWF2_38_10]
MKVHNGWILIVFVFFFGRIDAHYHNKTAYAPRQPAGTDEIGFASWHTITDAPDYHSKNHTLHTHISGTPFYEQSHETTLTGGYFSPNAEGNSVVVDAYNNTPLFVNTLFIHNADHPDDADMADIITFEPKRHAYGVRFDFQQRLFHRWDRLFLTISTAFASLTHDLDVTLKNASLMHGFSSKDFFAGLVHIPQGNNAQLPLTKAKMAHNITKMGFTDFAVQLKYVIARHKNHQLMGAAGILIPTGTTARGTWLWEPITGNGGHTGLTGNLLADMQLWRNVEKKASVSFRSMLAYQYLFKAYETRTLSLRDDWFPADVKAGWNFYYLGKTIGQTVGIPAANIFTKPLSVRPGSQGQALDAGYYALYKDQESVALRVYQQPEFILVTRDNDMSSENKSLKTGLSAATSDISLRDFDLTKSTNPSYMTHRLFASWAYTFLSAHAYPTLLGCGISYETTATNAVAPVVTAWLKSSISF